MKVPSNVVDNKPTPFPAGVYHGDIGEVEDRWSNDRETLFARVPFTNNSPGDETSPEVGNRIFREDICLRLHGDSLFDFQEITDDVPFLFQRAAGLLAGLAVACDAIERDEKGNVDFDIAGFVQDLREGSMGGTRVKYQVENRSRERKDTGETIEFAQARRFAPAS